MAAPGSTWPTRSRTGPQDDAPPIASGLAVAQPHNPSRSRHRMTSERSRMTPGDLLTAILIGGAVAAWWPLVLALRGPGPPSITPVVAHTCGMLAGYGVVVLLGLMSRAPLLERDIGSDVLTRWHARGGRLVLGLVIAHAWAATASWAESRRESAASATWHVLGLPYLMAATVGTVALVAVGVASARAARRHLSYERWHALHLTTYVAVALSFLHQLAGPDLAGHRVVQVLWALLYTHVFALLLRYRVMAPLRQAGRHRLRVVEVNPEGDNVASIVLEGQHLDELGAEPGQFFRWRFLTPDTWLTAHPFSLSAPPTDRWVRLTVKALGDGSARLQSIDVGTWVVAEGPYGAMTAARRTKGDVLLIAGGVGITPLRALFETLPIEPGQDLLLLYRARDEQRLLFRHELDEIARHRGARVRYLLGDDPSCLSTRSLSEVVPNLPERDVYVCGPPGMADAVRSSLREAGVASEQIHEERFTW
jgi:predicted ferric reductase